MKEQISKLIKVKSIVTLTLTVVFGFLALRGIVDADAFTNVFLIIIGFYFGVQSKKTDE